MVRTYSTRKNVRSRIVRSLAKTTKGGKGRISKRRAYTAKRSLFYPFG
jgi:hypothetical protein